MAGYKALSRVLEHRPANPLALDPLASFRDYRRNSRDPVDILDQRARLVADADVGKSRTL